MQVRMLCDYQVALDGFNVTIVADGDVLDVADDLGDSLIRNDKATAVDAPDEPAEVKAEPAAAPENKDAGAAPENKTVKPKRRFRKAS